jgi:hypothetical protein
MAAPILNSSRRTFLGNTLKLGAGSILLGSSLPTSAADKTFSPAKKFGSFAVLPELPTRVLIEHEGNHFQMADRQGSRFTSARAVVNLVNSLLGQEVRVTCPAGPLSRVVVRWETTFPAAHSILVTIGNAVTEICNGVFSNPIGSCRGILRHIRRPADALSWQASRPSHQYSVSGR